MVAQNNQHRLMRNWAAILTISSVLIIRVRYLKDLDKHIQQRTNTQTNTSENLLEN